MPELPKPPKGKGKGGARIFGFPWYVVAGGVVAAIALGLYLRHRSSSSGSAGTTAAPAQDTSGGAGGGSSDQSQAPPGVDLTGLQDSIDQLSSLLSYGPASLGDPGLSAAAATAPTSPYAFTPGAVARSDVSYGYVWPTSTPGIGTGVGVDVYGTPTSYALLGPSARANAYDVNTLFPNVGQFGKVTLAPSKSPVSHPSATVPPVTNHPIDHPAVAKTVSFAYPTTPATKLALTEHRAPPGGF